MTNRASRLLLPLAIALFCCSAPPIPARAGDACAGGGRLHPDDSGIGGTGLTPDGGDSGIGGTGKRPDGADDDDSGVGGTGIHAGDSGVIGTITGFASICVDGAEIHYDAASAVRVDGQPASLASLAVGEVVAVIASGAGSELYAQRIDVEHIVAGPLTRVASAGDEIEVLGQRVRILATTRNELAAATTDVALGTVITVSGMRQPDGRIAASLLRRSDDSLARLSGPVTDVSANRLAVAGTEIDLASAGTALALGDEVRVVGRWANDRLIASGLTSIPRLPFDGRVARLQVEGFAAPAAGGALRVGPYVFDLPDSAIDGRGRAQLPDARVRVDAVLRDRRAIIERIVSAPDPPLRPDPQARPDNALHSAVDGAGADVGGAGRAAAAPPPRPPIADDSAAPPRPDRPDRPAGAQPPERPPRLERPPIDRGAIPDRPPRPNHP